MTLNHQISGSCSPGYFSWFVFKYTCVSSTSLLAVQPVSPLEGVSPFEHKLGPDTCSILRAVLGCGQPSSIVLLLHLLHLGLQVRDDTTLQVQIFSAGASCS